MENPYQILGVAQDAAPEAIKKAYRQLAKRYHPDKNAGDAQAAETFKRITEAYDVLSNPEKRRLYDSQQKDAAKQKAQETRKQQKNSGGNQKMQFDPADLDAQFASFFGFEPKNQEVHMGKEGQKKANPLDTTELFERFMGFKQK